MAFLNTWTVDFRPNRNIPFYENSQEFLDHIQTKYISEGILLSRERELSFDELEETIRYRWEIPGFAESYLIHEIIMTDTTFGQQAQQRSTYNNANGILTSSVFYEIRDSEGTTIKRDEFSLEMLFQKEQADAYYTNKRDYI